MAKKPLEMSQLTKGNKLPVQGSVLKEIETRPFDGGLNVIDSELKLSSRFATHLNNIFRGPDGTYVVRGGSRSISSLTRNPLVKFPFGCLIRWVSSNSRWRITSADLINTDALKGPTKLHLGARFTFSILSAPGSINLGEKGQGSDASTTYYIVVAIDVINHYFEFILDTTSEGTVIQVTSPGDILVVDDFDHPLDFPPGTRSWSLVFSDSFIFYALEPRPVTQPYIGLFCIRRDTFPEDVDRILAVSKDMVNLFSFIWSDTGQVDDSVVRQNLLTSTIISYGIGRPYSWNPITYGTVTFAQWRNFVLIATKTNKLCLYEDQATGNASGASSNALFRPVSDPDTGTLHVPAGDIVAVGFNRVFVAGVDVDSNSTNPESTLYISAENTFSLFFYDALNITTVPGPPTNIDFSTILNIEDTKITGITSFRDYVVVTFKDAVVLGNISKGGDATAGYTTNFNVVDIIYDVGALSPNCIVSTGEDLYLADDRGLHSLKKSIYSGVIENNTLSQLVDPLWRKAIGTFRDPKSLVDRQAFAYYSTINNQFVFVRPTRLIQNTVRRDPTRIDLSYPCLVYSTVPGTKERSWSRFTNIGYNCAASNYKGDIVFAIRDTLGVALNPTTAYRPAYLRYTADNLISVYKDYSFEFLTSMDSALYDVGLGTLDTLNDPKPFGVNLFGTIFTDNIFDDDVKLYTTEVPFQLSLPSTELGEPFKQKVLAYVRMNIDGVSKVTTTPPTRKRTIPMIIVHTDAYYKNDENFGVNDNDVRYIAGFEPGSIYGRNTPVTTPPYPPNTYYKISGGIPVFRSVRSPQLIPIGIKGREFKFTIQGFAPQINISEGVGLRIISLAFLYRVQGIRK